MIDLPRSTFYYRATTKTAKLSDMELVTIIEEIQDELPCYGNRRVTRELRRRGHLVNHKRVARLGDQAAQALCAHDRQQPRLPDLPEPLPQCDPRSA